MALKMKVSEYIGAQRAYGQDLSAFLGYVLNKYFEFTGDLIQSEANDYLETFMLETKMDIFSNTIFEAGNYAITYNNTTKEIEGSGRFIIAKYFPSALEMSNVIDSLRSKARMNYGDIFEMTLIQFSKVSQFVGLVPSSDLLNVWFRYYQNQNILSSRSVGSTFYGFYDTIKISSMLELYDFNVKSPQDFFNGFVGLSYDYADGDLGVGAFNAMMTELYAINRLGIWGDNIDVAYDSGSNQFTGTELSIFRSRIIGQNEISGLIQQLSALKGGTFQDVSKLDFVTAVNIFENNYLGLK